MEHLKNFIRFHDFVYSRGLSVVILRATVQNNGEDSAQLFEATAQGLKNLCQNRKVSMVDGRHCFSTLIKFS